MTPVQWNDVLRGPWPEILTTVEREARAWLAANAGSGAVTSTRQLCEDLYPEKLARGENLEFRKRIMTALLKLSGFQLSDCNEAGEPVMRRGKMVRPRMWHAPKPRQGDDGVELEIGLTTGAEQERAAIVAWLHSLAHGTASPDWLADRIKEGKHHAPTLENTQAEAGPLEPAADPMGPGEPGVAPDMEHRAFQVGDRVTTPKGPGVVESIKTSIDLITVKLDGTGSLYSFRPIALRRADTKSIPNLT